MTRYARIPETMHDRGDGVQVYHNFSDWPNRFVVEGYNYLLAETQDTGNPETSYRPVTLHFSRPIDPIGVVSIAVATNGWRANRTYKITTAGATNTYGVMVNGIHIPVEFTTVKDAELFAQHIEDTNTES